MTTNQDTLFFVAALKQYQEKTGDLSDPAGLPTQILSGIVYDAQRLKLASVSTAVS